jgi:hypothetical protein
MPKTHLYSQQEEGQEKTHPVHVSQESPQEWNEPLAESGMNQPDDQKQGMPPKPHQWDQTHHRLNCILKRKDGDPTYPK